MAWLATPPAVGFRGSLDVSTMTPARAICSSWFRAKSRREVGREVSGLARLPQREVRLLITKRTVVWLTSGRGEPELPAKGTPVVVRLPLDALDTFILDEDQT